MAEDLEFLKECDLFAGLDEELIAQIAGRGELVSLPVGAKLFEIGQPTRNFYVIKNGVIEICRPDQERLGELRAVAYLGPSDSMGEMNMIIGGSHGSMARLPQGGEVLKISQAAFQAILVDFPVFTRHLLVIFAHRLDSRVKDQRIAKRHLNGNLRFFDLPTVIQTIISSQLTGTLMLTNDQLEPIAEVNFEKGEVRSAFLEELFGIEAFMQLFQPPPQDGAFDFKTGAIQSVGDKRFEIEVPTMNLLMESIRLQDELAEMKRVIKEEACYVPIADELTWDMEDNYYPLALQLWLIIQERKYTVKELRTTTLRSHYHCYCILQQLLQTEQIACL